MTKIFDVVKTSSSEDRKSAETHGLVLDDLVVERRGVHIFTLFLGELIPRDGGVNIDGVFRKHSVGREGAGRRRRFARNLMIGSEKRRFIILLLLLEFRQSIRRSTQRLIPRSREEGDGVVTFPLREERRPRSRGTLSNEIQCRTVSLSVITWKGLPARKDAHFLVDSYNAVSSKSQIGQLDQSGFTTFENVPTM